jgi:hypothetical protein
MPSPKRNLIAGAVATGITAFGILAYVVATGGVTGGGSRTDTSLDASTRTSPPTDWRIGYTRTGTIYYSQDATNTTTAKFDANELPYTTDATDVGWAIEPAQINRFPRNVSMACGGLPWVCSTATMDSTSSDPGQTATASLVTFGGGSIDATAFGYTASTALDFRIWAKCAGGGTLDATHVGDVGHWTVDATAMGTGWRLLYPARAEVTEVSVMTSDASGNFRLRLSGVDCAFWMPTATEAVSYHHSTIPTDDATGETVGAASWVNVDSTGSYYAASGVTKVESITTYSGGPCWSYSAPTITLSAASCKATWYALSLTWGY